MPARAKVFQLPPEVRAELDRKLIGSGFGGYTQLSEWLKESGHSICRSSLHEYGVKLEEQMTSMRETHQFALAFKEQIPDDAGAKADMLNSMAQEVLFGLLLCLHRRSKQLMDADPEDVSGDMEPLAKLIARVSRAAADINRASIAVKNHAAQTREKVEEKFSALEKHQGLDAETLNAVFEAVRGVI